MSPHPALATWPRRFLAALGVVALLAMLLFAWDRAAPETAQAAGPGPGMSLAAPATVFLGVPFTLTVNTAPAPDVEILSFLSEVLFPDGLKWLPRPNCRGPGPDGEVQVEVKDSRIDVCESFLSPVLGGAATVALTFIGGPLRVLNVTPGSITTLVALDFVCNTLGSHELTLTARPDSPEGAVYEPAGGGDLIFVKTVPQDYDGDTVANQVADTLTVNCLLPPDEQININVFDVDSGGKLEGTCWRISYINIDPLYPVSVEIPHDIVGDDVAGVKPDCGEPSNVKLFDEDPSVGNLTITITSAQRLQFGDIWHAQMSFGPVGPHDHNNYECDLSLGKCTIGAVAVGGLVVDLDEGALSLEGAQRSGGSAGRPAGTIAGVGALAVALTGAAWYARRRWAK